MAEYGRAPRRINAVSVTLFLIALSAGYLLWRFFPPYFDSWTVEHTLKDAANQTYAAHRYDAVYVLALAAAWAAGRDGRGALTGRRLAEGILHLVAGPRFGLTPDAFTAAKAHLQRGESIDVEGASGDLDFDRASGGVDAVYQLWRVRGRGFVPDRRLPRDR